MYQKFQWVFECQKLKFLDFLDQFQIVSFSLESAQTYTKLCNLYRPNLQKLDRSIAKYPFQILSYNAKFILKLWSQIYVSPFWGITHFVQIVVTSEHFLPSQAKKTCLIPPLCSIIDPNKFKWPTNLNLKFIFTWKQVFTCFLFSLPLGDFFSGPSLLWLEVS